MDRGDVLARGHRGVGVSAALARGTGVVLTKDLWHGMTHPAGRLGWVIGYDDGAEAAWLMLAATEHDPVPRLVQAYFMEFTAREHAEPTGPEWDELCARLDANEGGLFSG